jgi:hypothetical protein
MRKKERGKVMLEHRARHIVLLAIITICLAACGAGAPSREEHNEQHENIAVPAGEHLGHAATSITVGFSLYEQIGQGTLKTQSIWSGPCAVVGLWGPMVAPSDGFQLTVGSDNYWYLQVTGNTEHVEVGCSDWAYFHGNPQPFPGINGNVGYSTCFSPVYPGQPASESTWLWGIDSFCSPNLVHAQFAYPVYGPAEVGTGWSIGNPWSLFLSSPDGRFTRNVAIGRAACWSFSTYTQLMNPTLSNYFVGYHDQGYETTAHLDIGSNFCGITDYRGVIGPGTLLEMDWNGGVSLTWDPNVDGKPYFTYTCMSYQQVH